MNNSRNVACFLAGVAVGAAVAILYAPKRGEEIRKYSKQRIRELSEKGREAIRQGRELYEYGIEMTDQAAAMWEREVPDRIRETIAKGTA